MIEKIKSNFEKNLKGALAEQLTKELFFKAGYEVFYYGVEHLVPGFMSRTEKKNRDYHHKTNNVISNLPDFLVIKNGKSYYVETKFRMNGKFTLKPNYPFPDAYIIVFTKDNILIEIAKEISSKKPLKPLNENNLFEFENEAIEACIELLKKYFKE